MIIITMDAYLLDAMCATCMEECPKNCKACIDREKSHHKRVAKSIFLQEEPAEDCVFCDE